MTNERMRERIGKLLDLAVDQAGRPEGDRAAEAAMRLMERHGVTEADARAATEDNPMTREVVRAPTPTWRRLIAHQVGRLTGAFVAAGSQEYWLMGRRTDVEVAAYLLDSLANQCRADATRRYYDIYYGRREGTTDRTTMRWFRDSWVEGLQEKVDRVLEAQRLARTSNPDEALVPRGRRRAAVDWAKQNWRFKAASNRALTGMTEGRAAGRRATLHGGLRSGSGSRRLLND